MGDSSRKLFGTDGIRGVANQPPMTADLALRLGQAVAWKFQQKGRRARVVIGKDTRLSGYMFEAALEAGIVSAGADALMVGPMPTPGIAFITSSMRADAGIVISASHNPYQDNGIKLFGPDGYKLPDEVEADIEAKLGAIEEGKADAARAPGELGRANRLDDARGRYVQFLKNCFPRDRRLDGIRVVVDCAHGAAYQVAPMVLEELGAEVFPLGVSPNGRNINDCCGALFPETAGKEVTRTRAEIGVTLDGDADRVILIDEKGETVDGDQILAILGTRLLREGNLPGNTVVATVMSNLGLERALASAGGRLVRTAVGDRYVVEEMRANGYTLGGEQSGHLIFLERSTTGDGMVAALEVLSVMAQEGKPLSELAKVMTRYPQVLVNFKVQQKIPLEDLPAVQRAIQQVESDLGQDGRVVVRYSGTESKARVMIEGTDEARIQAYADEIATLMQRSLAN